MRRAGRLLAGEGGGLGVVELDAAHACARCARGRGCGAALFAPPGAPSRLRCALAGPLRPGAEVVVEVPEGDVRWLRPVLLAYGLPTLGLLAGAFVPEPWTPLGAVAGLGGGLLAWRLAGARLEAAARSGPCAPVARTSPFDRPDGSIPVLRPAIADERADREERSA